MGLSCDTDCVPDNEEKEETRVRWSWWVGQILRKDEDLSENDRPIGKIERSILLVMKEEGITGTA